jgi:hypothetical protein
MSRWTYRRSVHMSPSGGPNLVTISNGVATLGGKQLTEHLLCVPCERSIKRWEDYASEVALQVNGNFRARDAVTLLPDLCSDELAVADSAALDVPKLARFAVSVIWRASVSRALPLVSLGKYAEDARRYLLDDAAPIPASMRVSLTLMTPPTNLPVDRMSIPPYSKKNPGYHVHAFSTMGLAFHLMVGGEVSPLFDVICIERTGRVMLSDGSELVPALQKTMATIRKSPGLLKWEAKHGRRRPT